MLISKRKSITIQRSFNLILYQVSVDLLCIHQTNHLPLILHLQRDSWIMNPVTSPWASWGFQKVQRLVYLKGLKLNP